MMMIRQFFQAKKKKNKKNPKIHTKKSKTNEIENNL